MKYISALLLILFATLLTGQPALPPNMHHEKIAGGPEILVISHPAAPLVTINAVVRNGSFRENENTNGLAHLYENLFFKTNKQYPTREAIQGRIDELGIVFNATTSEERSSYFITLSNRFLDEGLAFMFSALTKPQFTEDEIKAEMNVINAKFESAERNPVYFLVNDVYRKLWGDQYPRKNAFGSREVMANATPAELEAMHRAIYHADNTLLIVSGNVKRDEVLRACRTLFSGMPAQGAEKPTEPNIAPLSASEGVLTLHSDAREPVLFAAFQGPDTRNNPDLTFAGEVLAYLLSQQNSPMLKELIEKEIVYTAAAGFSTQKYITPFTLFAVANPKGFAQLSSVLEDHIARWADDDYFTDEQIESAKNMLVYQEMYGRELPSELVHSASWWWASADISFFAGYLDGIRSVTRENLQQFVRQYIHNQPNVTGLLMSEQLQQMLEISQVNPIATSK